jgi:cupin 2 domain-containing protein
MVLRGEAVLAFEDAASVSLKAGDYVNIPARTRHRVEWTAPDIETVWLAIHY